MLLQITIKKYSISRKSALTFWKYFFPLFTYTTFPVIQVIYPYNLLSGFNRIFFIFVFIALNAISLFIVLFSSTQNKKDKLIRYVHILSIIILLTVYIMNTYWLYESNESFFVLITRWIRNVGKYLFLGLHFLCFPFNITAHDNTYIQKSQRLAILINALILPIIYIIFGDYDGRFLYVGLQQDSTDFLSNTSDSDYNNYLAIGDPLIFNSLLLLIAIPNLFSYILSLLTSILLALIGSRVAFITCLVVTVFSTSFIFYQTFSNLFNSLLLYISRRKKSSIRSIFKLLTLITFFVFFSFLIFVDIKDLLPNIFYNQTQNVISFQNIQSSRVWQTLFEANLQYDNSLNAREYLFKCHFDSLYNETSLAFFSYLFLGRPWQETGCGNYLHSFLSILFENGLVIFCLIAFLIFYRFKLIVKFYLIQNKRINIFIEASQIIYLIVTMAFLTLGLFARANLGFFLPILMFSNVHLTSKRQLRI